MLYRVVAFVLAIALSLSALAGNRPTAADRVLIISIDGCRPDLLLRAETPVVHSLLKESSFTFWAQTTPLALTLPSHTSMLTGVSPSLHKIMWNDDLPLKEPVYPRYQTIFEIAKKNGYTTACIAGKSKFDCLCKPKTVDWQYTPEPPRTTNEHVIAEAIRVLKEHQPQVMFVHFPQTDTIGHTIGWASTEQMTEIGKVDGYIGQLLHALDELKLAEKTTVILTADHGGVAIQHYMEDPRVHYIPWIMRGPGIRKNYDLTRTPDLNVRIEDTFATSCYVLGIAIPKKCEGKAVTAAFEQIELIKADR